MKAKHFMHPLRKKSAAGDHGGGDGIVANTGFSVSEDTWMVTCIYYMLQHPITQLPVLDKNKKVVGVLHGQDVLSSIILIAVVIMFAMSLWLMQGDKILPGPATFIW